MPNRSADSVFLLVKSLEKSEKRNFKLYVKRNSATANLKVIQLFDALEKMENYDEALLLRKNKALKKAQLSNLKAHLYKLLLSSLRLLRHEDNITLQLNELMDFARVLYNKGLYLQSLRQLEKAREMALAHQQVTYQQQILFFEKKIESLYITRSMQDRADALTTESEAVHEKLSLISRLSDLSLQLYSWYIRNGVARNRNDATEVKTFFDTHLPAGAVRVRGFYEQLYLYQSYCWYAFIRQDFLQYYRYAQKWVDLFTEYPAMLEVETAHYIKGMHNLMGAHFDLQKAARLAPAIDAFEQFARRKVVQQNDNYRILCFQYLSMAKINLHFLEGTFTEGLRLVPHLEEQLEQYEPYLDRHRVLVFYYKIACLYFGTGRNEKAIHYLNKIIHWKMDLRTDLQCYARLLHLIAHYELGNYDLLEYLIKSVYRYMAKMENLSAVEEEMFRFLRQSFSVSPQELKPAFRQLLQRIRRYEGNRFETRAFVYLDIISWLESKISDVDVQAVIREKYERKKEKT
ncbi:MAG TPA: hypothetical protein PKE63_10630 [Lacibacter sp.]|nr:hypothetical protein [Lacibacter sp.]HMO89309.1 hypothetical protein [Lacibacter sp.]HMP87724.1 hypothetical protein [Lacibacter sp.]